MANVHQEQEQKQNQNASSDNPDPTVIDHNCHDGSIRSTHFDLGVDGRREDYDCAVCLQHIAPLETSIIKGCEHTYCVTCILTWASFKQPAPWCPQCKGPFDYLYTYRSLDGDISDTLIEEPTVLLLQADWFNPTHKAQHGSACSHSSSRESAVEEDIRMFEVDEAHLFDSDEFDEREFRYAQRNGGGNRTSIVAGRVRSPHTPQASGSGRRAKRTARRRAEAAPHSLERSRSEEQTRVRQVPLELERSRSTSSRGKISSAKAKRLAKQQAKLEKETKKAAARALKMQQQRERELAKKEQEKLQKKLNELSMAPEEESFTVNSPQEAS